MGGKRLLMPSFFKFWLMTNSLEREYSQSGLLGWFLLEKLSAKVFQTKNQNNTVRVLPQYVIFGNKCRLHTEKWKFSHFNVEFKDFFRNQLIFVISQIILHTLYNYVNNDLLYCSAYVYKQNMQYTLYTASSMFLASF